MLNNMLNNDKGIYFLRANIIHIAVLHKNQILRSRIGLHYYKFHSTLVHSILYCH